MSTYYVAIDLGAESGRVSVACLNRAKLSLSEIHRFPNVPVREKDAIYWDIPSHYEGIIEGLRKVGLREDPISSISCDSWGVDYLLFDDQNTLIAPTYHYRDPRCQEGVKEVLSRLNWETIYAETGIQKMPINTIFQLGSENLPGGAASAASQAKHTGSTVALTAWRLVCSCAEKCILGMCNGRIACRRPAACS